MVDPVRYYHLETYLFEDVREAFLRDRSLGAFEFFSIVIWKANRAKSRIAHRLLLRDPRGRRDLELIVRDLTAELYKAPDARERLRILIEGWGFALPMASAILTVLWPEEFAVYDVRGREQLDLRQVWIGGRFETVWAGYIRYLEALKAMGPLGLPLRDKDRYLWGRSAAEQLRRDIRRWPVELRSGGASSEKRANVTSP